MDSLKAMKKTYRPAHLKMSKIVDAYGITLYHGFAPTKVH